MLGDQVRLEAYYDAIKNQVKDGMVVAEIGTGTGILSAYAAAHTKAQIFAIEYYESSAKMASDMMEAAGFTHVKVLNGESYGITLTPQPDILITETIGALGPEEHIVEICYDFKKRHPNLKTLVPSRLKVFAEPIRSRTVLDAERVFYDYYACASFGTFDYKAIRPGLQKIRSSSIWYDDLDDAETVGERMLLADYHLGVTELSAFTQIVDVSDARDADAVHIYFEATLDHGNILSTHYAQDFTHWRHGYVHKPKEATKLKVSYLAGSKWIEVSWES